MNNKPPDRRQNETRQSHQLATADAIDRVDVQPQTKNVEANTSNCSLTTTICTSGTWHPILAPMRATVERWHERGEDRARPVHTALAIINGRPSFAQVSRHTHHPMHRTTTS